MEKASKKWYCRSRMTGEDMTTRKEIEDTRHTVKALALMARKLGYTSRGFEQLQFDNGASATNLFDFFDDNPGAVQAVVEWVLEHGLDSEGRELEDEEDTEEGDAEEG